MANAKYDKARSKFLSGEINWVTDNIKAALVLGTYVGGSTAIKNHEFFTDIASHIMVGNAPIISLTGKAVSSGSDPNIVYGAAVAAQTQFIAITAAQNIGYVAIFKDSGSGVNGAPQGQDGETSPLLVLLDSGYGIGAGTNGSDIIITWNTTNGIFRL
jgi:hypothetical protein